MPRVYRLDVPADMKRLQREMDKLGKTKVKASARTATNKTIKLIARKWIRNVAAKIQVPTKALKKRVSVVRSTAKFPSGAIFFRSYPLKWKDIGTVKGLKTKGGVRVGSRYEASGFSAVMPSGYQSVFKRTGDTRFPIKELTAIIEPAIKVTKNRMMRLAQRMFIKEFEADIKKKIQREWGR